MKYDYIQKILAASIYDLVEKTPLDSMNNLSKSLNNNVLIKREDLQPVFSFKIRGAYNKLNNLTEKEKNAGVIAASAGNHAQGVALAASHLAIDATIIMPCTTPDIKVSSVKSYGATVVLHGDTFDEALVYALEWGKEKGMTFIHPYDDSDIISGQGTVGMEILSQYRGNIDAIFVPVGGGGLIAGIAVYCKYVRPDIKIIAVESEESACLHQAIEDQCRTILPKVGIFADGVAVAQIGEVTWEILKEFVDESITVTTDEICTAIKKIFEDTRSISEPAGALGVAGITKYVQSHNVKGMTFATIESGANINFHRLRHISERTELSEGKEAIFAVTIPEVKGSFRKFCTLLGKLSISEFNYRFTDKSEAKIFVGVKFNQHSDKDLLIDKMTNVGYPVVDLTENELAKLHVRYMVGGKCPQDINESIYRIEFPERPGALLRLLDKLGDRWNISMFHYRNHGDAYGRVFMGIEQKEAVEEVLSFMDELNYRYVREDGNEAYNIFLS